MVICMDLENIYGVIRDLCWKLWQGSIPVTMDTKMADTTTDGGKREMHASSHNELSPPNSKELSSNGRRACGYHRQNYASNCSLVPLLLLLTCVTVLSKLTYYRPQPLVAARNHPTLLIGDLGAQQTHNTSANAHMLMVVNRATDFKPAHRHEYGLQPLCQLINETLITIPSLVLAVKRCAPSLKLTSVSTKRSALGLLIIILSGDVQTNPGPIKFPPSHLPEASS